MITLEQKEILKSVIYTSTLITPPKKIKMKKIVSISMEFNEVGNR